jgi:hypothetical protein
MSTNPTRADAGAVQDLLIEITINPATKTIAIKENVNDPILFAYLIGQALQTYATDKMNKRKLKLQ